MAGDDEIESFWLDARVHANLNQLSVVVGESPLSALRPPAWAFGATEEQADRLLQAVLDGDKTATSSALWDYEAAAGEHDPDEGEAEPLPTVGAMSILLDGRGRPGALIVTTEVEVVAFADVSEAHAHNEGEGDRSLAEWRAVHQEFFTRHAEHDRGFSEQMPVVLERFEVLYRRPGFSPAQSAP